MRPPTTERVHEMQVLNIVIACGFCGNVIEVEEVPERVAGVEVIGIVRHKCAALLRAGTGTR